MSTRFKKLMHRFQENLATDEERHELMQMVDSGVFDEQIGDDWEQLLKNKLETARSDGPGLKGELKEIRTRILLEEENKLTKGKKGRSYTILRWMAGAAAVGVLLIMAVFWNKEEKNLGIVNPEIIQQEDNGRIYSGKQFVNLPDGSTVILNEKSQLKYGAAFGVQSREVYLTGEAYFDIRHQPELPFVVRTGKINTRVLGTAFNVEAWPDQSEVKVTVTRGKVVVGDDDHVYEELVPNEQLAVNTKTEIFEKKKLDAKENIEWKSGFFVLNKETMENAARRINKQYDVEVFIENKDLKKCRVNGAFLENESVEDVISMICLAMNADYSIEGGQIKIMGGIGCE